MFIKKTFSILQIVPSNSLRLSIKKSRIAALLVLLIPSLSWADFFGAKINLVNPTDQPASFEMRADNNYFQGCGVFSFGYFSNTDPDVLQRNFSVALAAFASQADVIFITDDTDRCKILAFWVQR